MNIYLFGKTSLSGETFYKNFRSEEIKIFSFSREDKDSIELDLRNPKSFSLINDEEFKIVSFAPIWELSYFLDYLFNNEKYKLKNLNGIIACSSTSSLTKKYEFNNFDKNLSANLISSENKIMEIGKKLKISCQIIRPTMIYGSVNGIEDKNISKILLIMRYMRFIVLPSNSGMRQPIHAFQLAEVVFTLIFRSFDNKRKMNSQFINVGGDDILSFVEMVKILKGSVSEKDNAKNCLILTIPNRLFFIFIFPIIIISPKYFSALSRICSNLSDFNKASEITKTKPKSFPLKVV